MAKVDGRCIKDKIILNTKWLWILNILCQRVGLYIREQIRQSDIQRPADKFDICEKNY